MGGYDKGSMPKMNGDGDKLFSELVDGMGGVRYVPDQPGPRNPDESPAAAAAAKDQSSEKSKDAGSDIADKPVTFEQMQEDQASSGDYEHEHYSGSVPADQAEQSTPAEQAGYDGAYYMSGDQQRQIGGETQGHERAEKLGHELGDQAGGNIAGLDVSGQNSQIPGMEGAANGADGSDWEQSVRADCDAANAEYSENMGEQEAGQEAGADQESEQEAGQEAGADQGMEAGA